MVEVTPGTRSPEEVRGAELISKARDARKRKPGESDASVQTRVRAAIAEAKAYIDGIADESVRKPLTRILRSTPTRPIEDGTHTPDDTTDDSSTKTRTELEAERKAKLKEAKDKEKEAARLKKAAEEAAKKAALAMSAAEKAAAAEKAKADAAAAKLVEEKAKAAAAKAAGDKDAAAAAVRVREAEAEKAALSAKILGTSYADRVFPKASWFDIAKPWKYRSMALNWAARRTFGKAERTLKKNFGTDWVDKAPTWFKDMLKGSDTKRPPKLSVPDVPAPDVRTTKEVKVWKPGTVEEWSAGLEGYPHNARERMKALRRLGSEKGSEFEKLGFLNLHYNIADRWRKMPRWLTIGTSLGLVAAGATASIMATPISLALAPWIGTSAMAWRAASAIGTVAGVGAMVQRYGEKRNWKRPALMGALAALGAGAGVMMAPKFAAEYLNLNFDGAGTAKAEAPLTPRTLEYAGPSADAGYANEARAELDPHYLGENVNDGYANEAEPGYTVREKLSDDLSRRFISYPPGLPTFDAPTTLTPEAVTAPESSAPRPGDPERIMPAEPLPPPTELPRPKVQVVPIVPVPENLPAEPAPVDRPGRPAPQFPNPDDRVPFREASGTGAEGRGGKGAGISANVLPEPPSPSEPAMGSLEWWERDNRGRPT